MCVKGHTPGSGGGGGGAFAQDNLTAEVYIIFVYKK